MGVANCAPSLEATLPPSLKYFHELQIQTVSSPILFSITAFCHSHPPLPATTPIKFLILWVNNSSLMIWSARGFHRCWKGKPGREFSIYYTRTTTLWPLSVAAVAFTVPIIYVTRSHYRERASALDFIDPRFCHSDVVFDLFIETRFSL